MNIQVIKNNSFLINNVLVGAPTGILSELKNMEFKMDDLNLIIITHTHNDQYYDLAEIIFHEYARKRTKPLVIIGPKDLKGKVKKLLYKNHRSANEYLKTLDLTFVDAYLIQNANLFGDYRFSFINIKLSWLKKGYALMIKNSFTTLGYSGEAKLCPGLVYLLKAVKTCIIKIYDNETKNALTLDIFKELANKYKISYISLGCSNCISKDITKFKNTRIINPHEQFFI